MKPINARKITERFDASDKNQTIARVGTSSSDSSEAYLKFVEADVYTLGNCSGGQELFISYLVRSPSFSYPALAALLL